MMQLSPRQSKAAALAVLAAVVLLAVGAVAIPLWLLNQRYDAAVEDAAARLVRYSRIVGMRDGLQKKNLEVKALEGTRHFLKSATPALAAAELQEQVKVILDENGGKLNSIQILPHKDDGTYRRIAISLQFNAPLSAIKSMLYAWESAHPYLFIENVQIRVPNATGARIDPLSEPELFVQMDVNGYALKGAP